MERNQHRHHLAIRQQLLAREELLWTGCHWPERRLGCGALFASCIIALVATAIANDQSNAITVSLGVFIATASTVLLAFWIGPSLAEPIVYALTTKRAIRALGRGHTMIDSIWLTDLTSVAFTEHNGFGTIRCASRKPTWALRRRNADRQPIFRRIVNPRGVHAMIIALRPDLAGSPAWDHVFTSRAERDGTTPRA